MDAVRTRRERPAAMRHYQWIPVLSVKQEKVLERSLNLLLCLGLGGLFAVTTGDAWFSFGLFIVLWILSIVFEKQLSSISFH